MTTAEHSPSSVREPSRESGCGVLSVTGMSDGGLGRSWGVREGGCDRDQRSAGRTVLTSPSENSPEKLRHKTMLRRQGSWREGAPTRSTIRSN